MKLMKTTLRNLWRLTRATSMVVGLAVMVGLVAGVASLAVAQKSSSGGTTASAVLKGVQNTAATATTLINNATGPALNLQVQPGNPPLTVNSGAGTATNLRADKVEGKDSSVFVSATNGKAPDSKLLDGKDSTEFLGAGDTAVNSDKLDGRDSTDFAAADTGTAFTDRQRDGHVLDIVNQQDVEVLSLLVPAGSYAINAKVWISNADDDDIAQVSCQLKAGGTTLDSGALTSLEELSSFHTPANETVYPLQAVARDFGTGVITVNCGEFDDSDRITVHHAVITAIRVGSVTF